MLSRNRYALENVFLCVIHGTGGIFLAWELSATGFNCGAVQVRQHAIFRGLQPCSLPYPDFGGRDLSELVGAGLAHQNRDFVVRRRPAILRRKKLDRLVALMAALTVFFE